MKINVRMEGGLGDHLLANRFAPAILDKYPNAQIKIFSDTENNHSQLHSILHLFGDFYARGGEVIEERKSKTYTINTRFGLENYPSHINNQKPETLEKMMDCDKFYDLHIDGLHWLKHDYDWLRYFYHFPKPHKKFNKQLINSDKYILTHLYARPDSPFNLNKSYAMELLTQLSSLLKVVVITQDKYLNFYEDIFENENIIFFTNEIQEIFNIASGCTLFIGMDSGIRYIPYHYSKPAFVFSPYCVSYNNVAYHHLIRWLIYKQYVLPSNTSIDSILKIVSNILSNNAYQLFPEIESDINKYIVNREI